MSFSSYHKPNTNVAKYSETVTLADTGAAYSSVLPDAVSPNLSNNNRYVSFAFKASAVDGTNLDIGLYSCDADGSNPVLLKDAVVADITATTKSIGVIDLNAYPSLHYKLGAISDADESSNTLAVEIYA